MRFRIGSAEAELSFKPRKTRKNTEGAATTSVLFRVFRGSRKARLWGSFSATKKGPEGPFSGVRLERGGLDAQARGGEGRRQAEEEQERRSDLVEVTLEASERHDTHP